MTRVQQLLISAKHLALWATSDAERRAAQSEAENFSGTVDNAAFDPCVRQGIAAVTALMHGIGEVRDPEAYGALRAGLALVVDGVRFEIARLARERDRGPPPRPYYLEH